MALTYISTNMIEQPVQFEFLSAGDLIGNSTSLVSASIDLASINSLQVTSATATNLYVQNLTADYFVVTTPSGKTFTIDDNSKAYHFDTSGGPLSATFPKTLPIGFNVSLYNVGNNSITLSSDGVINTPGNSKINNTIYTGMFIYKAESPDGLPPEGVFYGVGIFQ